MTPHTLLGILFSASLVALGGAIDSDLVYKTRPKIIGNFLDSTVTLDAGDNFTLLCEGELPVVWHVGAPGPGNKLHSSVTTEDVVIEGKTNKTARRLNLTDAQYYDTGKYSCYFQEDQRQKKADASVHIFVRDPDHALVPYGKEPLPMLIRVFHYKQSVIPCLVTDPTINVTLIKQAGRKVVDSAEEVTYDPKVGFTLLYPNFYFSGKFYCEAESPNKTIDVIPIVMIHNRLPGSPPYPYIDASAKQVMVGQTFSLTCKVKLDADQPVIMKWEFKNEGQKDNYVLMKGERRRIQTGRYIFEEVSNELRVLNAEKDDEGVYKCITETNGGLKNSASVVILVHEKSMVYLIPEDTVEETTRDSREAFLHTHINAFPRPVLKWFFNGKLITNETYYKQEQTEKEAALRIFFPTSRLNGNYTLFAQTPDMNSSVSFTVKVYGPTEITLTAGEEYQFFQVGKTYKLICEASGYPAGDVTWLWQECASESCPILDDEWTEISRENKTFASTLIITASQTGYYRCHGQNVIGGEHKDFMFIVTDQPASLSGINIISNRQKVVRGDKLRLECHVSRWVYLDLDFDFPELAPAPPPQYAINKTSTPSTTSTTSTTSTPRTTSKSAKIPDNSTSAHEITSITSGNGSGSVVVTMVTETPRVQTFESRTPYSIVKTILFHELLPEDEGIYRCNATSNTTHVSEMDTYYLYLSAIISPSLIDQTTGEYSVKEMSSFRAECLMHGFPTPNITWFKDGNKIYMENELNITIDTTQGSSRLMIGEAHKIHAGSYYCEGENVGGKVQSANLTLKVGESVISAGFTGAHIGIIVGVAIIVIIILIVVIIKVRHMKAGYHKELEELLMQPKGEYNPDLPIDEQTACLPYDPKWEFPKDRLRLGMILGQGAFGRVMKAEAFGIVDGEGVSIVAVKMVKDCTDQEQMMALLSELKILIHVGQHLNIVNLLGAVTKNIRFGELYVLVEYCLFGNLRNYLIKNKEMFKDTMEDYIDPELEKKQQALNENPKPHYVNKPAMPESSADLIGPSLTTKNLICWSFQVARGMEYLSSRKYIHRDLAARNVLLAKDNVVKICDFGLAKDCYKDMEYKKKGDGPVPVKWMALESFTHRIYTTKSDVWSYGILLWELFSLGGNPYPGVEINEKFIGLLKSGYRMEKPQYASDDLFKLMLLCWHGDPNIRPSFSNLVAAMGDFLEANVKQYYLDLNTTYVKMVDEEGATGAASEGYLRMNGKPDYTPMLASLAEPESVSLSDHEDEPQRYMNQKMWRKEKSEDHELTPLHKPDKYSRPEERQSRSESPLQIQTEADVHNPDDSDSGHSSSYAPGSSPIDNNGYLVPKALEPETEPLVYQDKMTELKMGPGKENHSDESVRSCGSSGFNSDYRDQPPPAYTAVMEDEQAHDLSV